MEATAGGAPSGAATGAGAVGGSSDVTSTFAYDEDSRHGPFAIAASQVPKPAGGPLLSLQSPGAAADGSSKDVKSVGTRFHEDCHETDLPSPRLRSSRLFKGKGKETLLLERERRKPLRLLDLPVDILKDIVKEVTHTNDLTSLARCHSALHRLAIPHIYSRFDIVWPDSSTHAEPRSGVDALTYGLATLVLAEEIFGEAPAQRHAHSNRFTPSGQGRPSELTIRRRVGNHYAQFTRKFSLGNGPADWVQEYLITKEGGKMLGTLVALAVARMRVLETFIWDMPTGILRDVWLCLASLGDRQDGLPCKLEKVWVRWHDNSTSEAVHALPPPLDPSVTLHHPPPLPPPMPAFQSMGDPTSSTFSSQINAALDRVEHPSFSVLPALKSLSVLDIDELAYLDEMAVLIGKSLDKLRELRVGIARHATARDWVSAWEGEHLRQVDAGYPTAGSLTIGEKRLGGVLGTLTGFVSDMRKPKMAIADRLRRRSSAKQSTATSAPPIQPGETSQPGGLAVQQDALIEQVSSFANLTQLRDVLLEIPGGPSPNTSPGQALLYEDDPLIATSSQGPSSPIASPLDTPISPSPSPVPVQTVEPAADTPVSTEPVLEDNDYVYLDNVLQLDSLELERVPLCIPVLQRAFDWTRLTSLTLLHCHNHEQLWKTLRRTFAPTPRSPTYPQSRHIANSPSKRGGKSSHAGSDIELEYGLKLKKIHTNTVSPALISFLKDTLAPNSLEVLFLQEARSFLSSVSIDHIYKGPLRRHRHSLRKVLIDSSEKGPDGLSTGSNRWRRWMLNREILSFMCSGKMPALRELGMAVDYRDWHFFLQHLPSIPHLRSLYIPFLADHVHGTSFDPRELALQIVDIVALRPEVELCYMGIANKCFEILENRRDVDGRGESHLGLGGGPHIEDGPGSDGEDDEDEDDGDDDVVVEEVDEELEELDDTETDEDDDEETDDEDDGDGIRGTTRLRLREILFYDDKVAVFKARHGRL